MSGSSTGSPPKYVFAVAFSVPVGSPSLFSTGLPERSWSTGIVYVDTFAVRSLVIGAATVPVSTMLRMSWPASACPL